MGEGGGEGEEVGSSRGKKLEHVLVLNTEDKFINPIYS